MYLLPKPKTIKEQDGQMLLCHSTHIVMTKEVAETEMHAAKRLQEAIRQETGLIRLLKPGEKEIWMIRNLETATQTVMLLREQLIHTD